MYMYTVCGRERAKESNKKGVLRLGDVLYKHRALV